jgi:DNA-binding transcriptional ArsR family regulator
MRIVSALSAGKRRMSVADLVVHLGDVPQATVYRQVRTLERAGLIAAVEHRAAGGASQALYAVPDLARLSDPENFRGATPSEFARLFQTFVAGLAADFERSVRRPGFNLVKDRIVFVQEPLYLTAGEIADIRRYILKLMKLRERTARPGRELRSITVVSFPLPDPAVEAPAPARRRAPRPKTQQRGAKKVHS